MNTIWIVLPILTLLMFELGLNLEFEDFKLFKYRPKPVIAGLVGQIIVLPALAWLIGWALKLEPIFLIGFVLIACCPGGSSSNVFSMIAKGDVFQGFISTKGNRIYRNVEFVRIFTINIFTY